MELKERLYQDYKIELEMALDHYAVAMTGLGSDDTMPPAWPRPLVELDEKAGPWPGRARPPGRRCTPCPPAAAPWRRPPWPPGA